MLKPPPYGDGETNTMTPSLKTALLGAAAALALTACGGKDDKSDGTKMEMTAKKPAASPIDKPFTLANASATDVDGFLEGMGMNGLIEYDSSTFDENLGAQVLTNVRMAGSDALKIGRVELFGFNEDAITTMMSGEPMTDMAEVVRKVRAFDFSHAFPVGSDATDPEAAPLMGVVTAGALELDKLELMVPAMGEGGEMQQAAAGAKAVAVGGLFAKNLSLNVPMGAGGEGVTMAAPDLRLKGYEAGVFGGLFAQDLSFSVVQSEEMIAQSMAGMPPQMAMLADSPLGNILFPRETSGSYNTLSWDGFSFAGMLPFMEAGEMPPATENGLISIGALEALGAKSIVNGKTVSTVKKTTMAPVEFAHFMPKKIDIKSIGSKADLTAYLSEDDAELMALFTKNGLDSLEGDGSFLWDYKPAAQTIGVALDSTTEDFATMAFDLDIASFDYAALMSGEEAAMAAGMATALSGMTLRIEDEKLLDTIFDVAAFVGGGEQTGDQIRQQAQGLVTLGALQGGQISPRIPTYATAVASWLGEGGKLEIKAAPAQPAAIGALQSQGMSDPASVLETLDVTVTHGK